MTGHHEFTLVQLNDSHGYLDLHPEMFWERGGEVYRKAGGFGRIATLVDPIRQSSGPVRFADGGDALHGTYPVVATRGQAMILTLNALGLPATPLHRYAMLESAMDNFLLASILESSGAQLAFSNGWRYGAPIVPGPITLNDLYNIIPMNPPVSTVDVTGDEVRVMLEENLERTFAEDPYDQMGGYVKRALGLTAFVKIENPNGERIQNRWSIEINVTQLQLSRCVVNARALWITETDAEHWRVCISWPKR